MHTPAGLLLVASVLLPLALFAFLAWQSWMAAQEVAWRRVGQTTAILHEHALRVFELNAAALDRMVDSVAADSGGPPSPAEVGSLLRSMARVSPTVQTLWIYAPDGSAIASSAPRVPPGPIVPDREYFVHHRTHPGDASFVSAPLVGRVDGRAQFVLSRRLSDAAGGFAGVASSAIFSDYFISHWRGLAPELDSSAALVRQDGVVLVRYPPVASAAKPLPAESDFMRALRQRPSGMLEVTSAVDGLVRLAGYRKLGNYPVFIAYTVSKDAVLAQWYRGLAIYGALCGGAAAALVAMSLSIRRRVRRERRLVEDLRRTDESRTRFFANVSHELRTPLALILGPVERLLASAASADEVQRQLKVVERSARVLHRRVSDLLDVAKLEAGQVRLNYVRTDVAELVRLVGSHFDSAAREHDIAFAVHTPPRLVAELDAAKLERVLFNLLSNALKFTPGGGRVLVALDTTPGQLRLSVEDSGPGVPPPMRERVFQRFTQADDSSERVHGGTGLGLAIVREFVELHGGRVALRESSLGGARFEVMLPLAAPAGIEVPEVAAARLHLGVGALDLPAPAAAQPLEAEGSDAHVLVVEDHPEMNVFLTESLRRRYRVSSAFNGQEGLAMALRDPPDLIILDEMMPVMSGSRMIEALRGHPALSEVPVLMLTAKADDAFQAGVLRSGAQDVLSKPFNVVVLLARVERVLGDRRRAGRRLQSSEQRLSAILQTARDAIVVTDGQHRILLFNLAAEAMFGHPGDSVLGRSIEMLFPPADWNSYLETIRVLPGADAPLHATTGSALRAGGTTFPIESSISKVVDAAGETFHTVVLRDITERVRDRDALVRANVEVKRVTEAFQQVLMTEVEDRQAQVARELHDSVGAALIGVSLLLGAARSAAGAGPAAAALDSAQGELRRATEIVRRISRGIMPAGTDPGALLQAMEQFSQDMRNFTDLDCTFRARGRFDAIAPDAGTHLYRIAQEATTNAIRHGKATRVRITLAEREGCYRLVVTDNGSGCDFTAIPEWHPGMGIRSMRARALTLQGVFEAGPGAGGGCRVRVRWPAHAAGGPEAAQAG